MKKDGNKDKIQKYESHKINKNINKNSIYYYHYKCNDNNNIRY